MIRGYRLLIEMTEGDIKRNNPQNAIEELRSILFTFFRFSKEHKEYFKAIMEYETKKTDM